MHNNKVSQNLEILLPKIMFEAMCRRLVMLLKRFKLFFGLQVKMNFATLLYDEAMPLGMQIMVRMENVRALLCKNHVLLFEARRPR